MVTNKEDRNNGETKKEWAIEGLGAGAAGGSADAACFVGDSVKVDVLGRVRIGDERREALLDAFEARGGSAQGFARVHGIKPSTFSTWVEKRRRSAEARMNKPLDTWRLVEVDLSAEVPSVQALELVLPAGLVVRFRHESQLDLLKSLIAAL